MSLNQKGFGVIEGLLTIIALTLIIGVGFYVVNTNKSDDDTNTKTTATEPTKNTKTPATSQQSKEDQEAPIIEAVKQDSLTTGLSTDEAAKLNVIIDSIVGSNAKGHVAYATGANSETGQSGAGFIAHKENGEWKVIFRGQEKPGKDIGTKYNLPTEWYSTDY